MAKQDVVVERCFCMAQMWISIELQSDMRGIVIIILDLFTWHRILMYWRVLGSEIVLSCSCESISDPNLLFTTENIVSVLFL